MTRFLPIAAMTLTLAACANPPPISNAPIAQQAAAALNETPLGKLVQQGAVDANWNFQQAIAIGVLPANDPAAGCMGSIVADLGIDPTTGQPAKSTSTAPTSFVPKESDLISFGSVLYIQAQQLIAAKNAGLPPVSVPCEALLGKLVIDAMKAGINVGIGGAKAISKMVKGGL